jgi:hypothetical protein
VPELPPPLPPGRQTAGQIVAEAIRLYGAHFWRALPLGLPLAVAYLLIEGRGINVQVAILCALAPVFAAAFAFASSLALVQERNRRRLARATAVGTLIWLPAPLGLRIYVVPMLAWLTLFGLAVPAVVAEGLGVRAALARGRRLATVRFAHAFVALVALLLVVLLSSGVLSALLHGQGESTRRVASALALLVLSPLLYLGEALLFQDHAARIRSRDADLHPALEADPAGRADPQVEP